MIGFRVDDISFYANKVTGHVGAWDTNIRIYGLVERDRKRIMEDYLKRWAPQGYATTAKYVVRGESIAHHVLLERRNSCD